MVHGYDNGDSRRIFGPAVGGEPDAIDLAIPPALRSDGGYRKYSETEVRTLQFVQRARRLGFSVKEVARLLALWRDKTRASAEVKALTLKHATEIDAKIAELRSLRATLVDLADRCHGDHRPDCPILNDLAGDDGEA